MTYTELNTINNKRIRITVESNDIVESKDITFTCKQATINFITRLNFNITGTKKKICINDNIRKITYKHNLHKETEKSQSKEKRLNTNNVKYRPNELVVCERDNKEITRERVEKIMFYIELNNFDVADALVTQYFTK
tara:strand:+ start:285 stop:695 length:411 start_codon:yes stop_codon:yes gene_type:complete